MSPESRAVTGRAGRDSSSSQDSQDITKISQIVALLEEQKKGGKAFVPGILVSKSVIQIQI